MATDRVYLPRQVDRRVGEMARDVIRVLRIPGKDAVHVASAVLTRCSEIHTYDERHLLKKSEMYGSPPLRIVKPNWPGGLPPLPDSGTMAV